MKLYPRENYLKKIRGFYHAEDLIKVITGVRRCGKSSLMQTIADELKGNGIADENILYFDLDLRSYKNIKNAEQLESLIEEKGTAEGKKYLFIDEIQNVSGFEKVLNGFRGEGEWSIFITGSNSYLLSGELVTKLTGRYLEFELFPLTFEEYEDMKSFYGKKIDPYLLNEMNNYILEGGFPRTIQLEDMADKRTYVQVAYTIALSKETEDREYRVLESIKDNFPKYVATTDPLLQKRNGIKNINLVDFMKNGQRF